MAAVRGHADPEALNELRARFRRSVPLHLRSYVAAWLASELAPGPREAEGRGGKAEKAAPEARKGREPGQPKRQERAKAPAEGPVAAPDAPRKPQEKPPARKSLPPESATVLFISAGRMRRFYPKDAIALLEDVAGIDRDSIGDIRVMDGYSFVQVLSSVAEACIEALNGYEYRGRPLTVNVARKKGDAPSGREGEDAGRGAAPETDERQVGIDAIAVGTDAPAAEAGESSDNAD